MLSLTTYGLHGFFISCIALHGLGIGKTIFLGFQPFTRRQQLLFTCTKNTSAAISTTITTRRCLHCRLLVNAGEKVRNASTVLFLTARKARLQGIMFGFAVEFLRQLVHRGYVVLDAFLDPALTAAARDRLWDFSLPRMVRDDPSTHVGPFTPDEQTTGPTRQFAQFAGL